MARAIFKEFILKKLAIITSLVLLTACEQQTLQEYRPVVDPAKSNPAKFEQDLAQCRAIATQAEANYKQQQNQQLTGQVIAGAVVGGLIGAAFGNSDWAAAGATYGAASGVAATDFEQAHGGPRRIIDRCMTERGHRILSDLGRG